MVFTQDSRTEDAVMGSIARIWAARKIGGLLNQVRLNGPDEETIAQIVRLSVRFGIITPYTSYLVDEPMPLGIDAQNKIAEDAFNLAQTEPTEVTGQGAVERALQESELKDTGAAPQSVQAGSDRNAVYTAGGRTFVYTQDTWTDTTFDPKTMVPVEVPFLSEEYFTLAQSRPDLAAALALGERVIVVADGKVYRVTAEHAGTMVQSTKVSKEDPLDRGTDIAATPVLEQDQLVESPTPLSNTIPGKSGGCPPVLMFVGLALLVSLLKKKGLEK
jgi:Ca-activated chloride channel homolog